MNTITTHKENLLLNGFTIIDAIYSNEEVEQILVTIEKADKTNERLGNHQTCLR